MQVVRLPRRNERIVLPRTYEKTVKQGRPTKADLTIARKAEKGNHHHYYLPEGAEVRVHCYKATDGYFRPERIEMQVEYQSCTFNLHWNEVEGAVILPPKEQGD